MKTIIRNCNRLGMAGFNLNHHIKGGNVVILPFHAKGCEKSPCSCGALEAMPVDVVNGEIHWPDWKKLRESRESTI